jgi:hypothetical protein
MLSRCSICRHPQRDSIDVSVLRDGTRSTARQFQVSRPALDRHKRHLSRIVARSYESPTVSAAVEGASPTLPRLEALIQHCEGVIGQARADKKLPAALRAIRELRAYLELKCKLESEARKHEGRAQEWHQQKSRISDEEVSLRVLNRLYWNTKGFHPLKIWQLKTMFESTTRLAQAKLEPKDIAERMALRDVGGVRGHDVTFEERVFGILRAEEWRGREEEVAQKIAQNVRDGLKGYPGILQHLDAAFQSFASCDPPSQNSK